MEQNRIESLKINVILIHHQDENLVIKTIPNFNPGLNRFSKEGRRNIFPYPWQANPPCIVPSCTELSLRKNNTRKGAHQDRWTRGKDDFEPLGGVETQTGASRDN